MLVVAPGLSGALGRLEASEPLVLKSPNSQIEVSIHTGDLLSYQIAFRGETVVESSRFGIVIDGVNLGENAAVSKRSRTRVHDKEYKSRGVHSTARNHYCSTTIDMVSGSNQTKWQVELRLYDDGVGFRYHVPAHVARRIDGEKTEWVLPADTQIWHQTADNFSYEAPYVHDAVEDLPDKYRLMVPTTVKFANNRGYGMLTEANLVCYSDMALEKTGTSNLAAVFQHDPGGWNHEGDVTSPWRVTLLAQLEQFST